MPEPNTLSHLSPDPEPPLEDGKTVGWAPQSKPSAPELDPTYTREAGSTPGAAHPDLHTRTEDTERLPPASSEPADYPAIPGYHVEKLVGRGAMATVYRAVHLETKRVVALKLINPGGRDEFYVRERFEREVQTLASVEHPNVVPIFHSGRWHGFPFLTMKFIPAGSLNLHLARFKGNSKAAARLVAKIARGVQALHDAGILHRDLKPLNILLGSDDEPLVADFGLAKWRDESNSELTVTHIPLGTRQYMSPEQTLGLRTRYGPPCDIWAIGIILHELLAGRRPFRDTDTTELFESIRTADAPPLPAGVPEVVVSVVRKCLAKNPDDRYQSAAAVSQHLEDWLAGRPFAVPAEPPPAPGPASPPWIVTVCVCALLALVFLPAVLIPFGQAREVPPVVENVLPPTVAQVFNRVGDVLLTDDKGKLLYPTRTIPGFDLVPQFRNGYQRFWTLTGVGMLEFTDEKLPLPLRLEADIALSAGSPGGLTPRTFSGIYIGRRNWPGGPCLVQSCVRFSIEEGWSNEGIENKLFLRCMAIAYLWERQELGAHGPLGDVKLPWEAEGGKADNGPRFCHLVVDIHEDRLNATIDGKPMPLVPRTERNAPPHIKQLDIAMH